jgi:glycosyltransferase involved in cell wall biosynthesis
MPNNTISVIIPTFNRSHLIETCIQSVFQQTYKNFEVIVVDDGSTDNTKKVLEPYIQKKQIKYFYQKNRGQGAARNYGARHAKGEWLAFLDSDDTWKKDKLKKQINAINSHPEVALIFTNGLVWGNGKLLGKFYGKFCPLPNLSKPAYPQLLKHNFVINSSVIIKKPVYFKVGKLSQLGVLRNTEDYDLWLRVAQKHSLYLIKAPLINYNYPSSGHQDLKKILRGLQFILLKNLIFASKENRQQIMQRLKNLKTELDLIS